MSLRQSDGQIPFTICGVHHQHQLSGTKKKERQVLGIATYIGGIHAVLVASIFGQLNIMHASRHELCVDHFFRIVVFGRSIPTVVHFFHDGPDVYLEAQTVEYGVEDCVDALEGVRETLGVIRLVVGISVMAIESQRTTWNM